MSLPNPKHLAEKLGGAKREGKSWRCLCPVHGDRSPSLSLSESPTGKLLVKCWSGCDPAKILKAINRLTGQKIQPLATNDRPPQSQPASTWVQKLWETAKAIQKNDLAALYLKNRGMPLENFPESLRFHPRCRVSDVPGVAHLPALLARFDSPKGEFSTCHRIYLTEPGAKADIDRPKRICSSPAKGGAIRLQPANTQLAICEGVETGLAIHCDTGLPVWAAYSAGMLPSVVVPASVQEVFIFGDNDESEAGQNAAYQLQDRLLNEGRKVKTLIPARAGWDWLDELVRE